MFSVSIEIAERDLEPEEAGKSRGKSKALAEDIGSDENAGMGISTRAWYGVKLVRSSYLSHCIVAYQPCLVHTYLTLLIILAILRYPVAEKEND